MSLETLVKHFNYQDLNGNEIQRLIGKAPVVYSDLQNNPSLESLLGKEKYFVLLYQTSNKTTGHYVCISANDKGVVRFVDSYGFHPAQIRTMTPYDDKYPTFILNLLEPYQVEYNTFDYQGKKGISTCGRWASLFCKLRNVPLSSINRMFTTNKSEFMNDYDNVATLLTLYSLDDISKFLISQAGRSHSEVQTTSFSSQTYGKGRRS
jgi:hypothetical protein